jgi:hypothetical protein
MDVVNPVQFLVDNPPALLILAGMAVIIVLVLWWAGRRS